ncbi:MAG: prefoldin subunit beta [Candidatus Aenigmarchaeota archaeon]|nr:prefoldin subunit beta [Candidatus Aenigmarchaeota archaeon]
MEKKAQEAVGKLQVLEQNMQQIEIQKQQFTAQLLEIENALKELETAPEAYKLLGNILVKTEPKSLKSELCEKQERLKIHISVIDKQEKQLSDKTEKLRKEILGTIKTE